jgi:UPF0755 protein
MLVSYLKNTLKLAAVILLLCVSYTTYEYRISTNIKDEIIVYIPHHTSSREIAKILQESGAINSPRIFIFMSRLNSYFGNYLKHGQYKIKPNSTQSDIIETLVSGDIIKYNITIPEGLSKSQILEILNSSYGLIGEVDLNTYKEGWLMPDTYEYTYNTEKKTLLDSMNNEMKKFISSLNFKGGVLNNEEELLTLASIVEEEASVPEERGKIAAVYLNRLNIGMALQADPTVIYGITNGKYDLGRLLILKDLLSDSKYNTYLNKGLPPTPISNPGRASILAILNPSDVKYIYFVADGLGGHKFSENYIDHKKNVAEYRSYKSLKKKEIAQ